MSEIFNILIDLLNFLWGIASVLVPIMIVIEISDFFNPVSKFFTLSKTAGISLLFGIFFGLITGAGAILQSVRDYNVDKRSVFLISMFLSPCHAVFEDAFIMGAVGASILPLLVTRFISAIIVTFILSRSIKKEPNDIVARGR